MKENLKIDELLNAYVDQELDARQRTEVKRLVDHDPKISERLDQIRKCRKLVNSLPAESAPAHMFEDIRAALERQTLLSEPTGHREHKKGTIGLMFRKVLSAAAMLALVGGLTLVVLNVVMPPKRQVASIENNGPEISAIHNSPDLVGESISLVFNGKLETKPEDFAAADKFLNKALAQSGLAEDFQVSDILENQKIFTISCSRKQLDTFLKKMAGGWRQLGVAKFTLPDSKDASIVDTIQAGQLIQIADQRDLTNQVKAAKYYGLVNSLKESDPDQTLATNKIDDDYLDIPQPTFTSSRNKSLEYLEDQGDQKTRLEIVLKRN